MCNRWRGCHNTARLVGSRTHPVVGLTQFLNPILKVISNFQNFMYSECDSNYIQQILKFHPKVRPKPHSVKGGATGLLATLTRSLLPPLQLPLSRKRRSWRHSDPFFYCRLRSCCHLERGGARDAAARRPSTRVSSECLFLIRRDRLIRSLIERPDGKSV